MTFDIRTTFLATVALATFVAAPATAEELDDDVIVGEFVQRGFDDRGRVKVRFWGRDADGDGRLYSMSGFLATSLPLFDPNSDGTPLPVGNEFIRVEVTYCDYFGLPSFTQVFDERETPIDQTPNFGPTAFYGFAYNLDGGRMGDDPDEGMSLSPLAPSIAYVAGELFRYLLGPGFPELRTCAPGSGTVCAAVQQINLTPGGIDIVNESYSDKRISVKKKLNDNWNQCDVS